LKQIATNLPELFVKVEGDKLVMGETISGKIVLLDVFVNYLADMNYEDK